MLKYRIKLEVIPLLVFRAVRARIPLAPGPGRCHRPGSGTHQIFMAV